MGFVRFLKNKNYGDFRAMGGKNYQADSVDVIGDVATINMSGGTKISGVPLSEFEPHSIQYNLITKPKEVVNGPANKAAAVGSVVDASKDGPVSEEKLLEKELPPVSG